MTILTQARLKELLQYDSENGTFTRIVGVKGAAAGTVAGSQRHDRYITICVDYRDYLAHRLAWLYMVGDWPAGQLDHIDCDPSNNKWSNIRDASQTLQNANTKRRKDNISGYKGVGWDKKRKGWRARICVHGQQRNLGVFQAAQDAHLAYVAAAKQLFGEFARAK